MSTIEPSMTTHILARQPLPEAQPNAPQAVPVSNAIRPDRRVSKPAIIGAVLAFDVVAILAAAVLALRLSGQQPSLLVVASVLLSGPAILLILQQIWGYTVPALGSRRQQLARVGAAVGGGISLVVVGLLVAGIDIIGMRGWLLSFAALSFVLMTAGRWAAGRQVRRWTEQGRLARRAVIVGGGRPVADLVDSLREENGKAIEIMGIFDDRGGERSPQKVADQHKIGGFDEMVAFCREHAVDLIIITLPHTAEQRILYLLKKLWVLPLDIRISALGSKLKLRPRAYTFIGKTPFLAVFDRPLTDWGQAVKAVEDRVLAGLALVLLSPVMLGVAIAVKLTSKGPVFFKQTRYGFNNEAIGVYKFRSMYVDQCDAAASKLVTKGDPRVTPVGRVIRKTSLDELPQLFNVLKGELSMVGPRPHALQAKADGQIYDEVVEGYFARHRVKPGITGWAQINGWRGETDTVDKIERRVEYDLQYIDNWSVFFDLYILAMTPASLLNTKNAY
jgi:Undecaprenyl-phosphate glucose phosphotransferase